jgi:hypothetical protein
MEENFCLTCEKRVKNLTQHQNEKHKTPIWCENCQHRYSHKCWSKHKCTPKHLLRGNNILAQPISNLVDSPQDSRVVLNMEPSQEFESESDDSSDISVVDELQNQIQEFEILEPSNGISLQVPTMEVDLSSQKISDSENDLLAWRSKYNLSEKSMEELFSILKSDTFKVDDVRKSYHLLNSVESEDFTTIQKVDLVGISPEVPNGIPITLYSIRDVLTKYLSSPVGFSTIVPKFTGDLKTFGHFTTGLYFYELCSFINKEYPHEIPLCLLLFHDPFRIGKKNKCGNIYLGILNSEENILLSPKTKMVLSILPRGVPVNIILKPLVEEIKELIRNPLEIVIRNQKILFFVTISMFGGDSFDLNKFCGLRSFQSGSGCRSCWVPRDQIKNFQNKFGRKKKEIVISLQSKYQQYANKNMKTAVEDATSVLGIPNSATHSPILDIPGTDPCLLSPIDLLHNERLGLIQKEVLHIYEKLEEPQKSQFIKKLVQLPLPKNCDNLLPTIFDKPSKLSGKEWGLIMWNSPLALVGVIPVTSLQYKCLILHACYYRLLCKDKLNMDQLDKMVTLIEKHHTLYRELYPEDFQYENSLGNSVDTSFINFHSSQHWKEFYLLFGAAKYFSVEALEAKHKLLKDIIRSCTNHKNLSTYLPLLDFKQMFSSTLKHVTNTDERIILHNKRKKVSDKEFLENLPPTSIKNLHHYHTVSFFSSSIRASDYILFRCHTKVGRVVDIIGRTPNHIYILCEKYKIARENEYIPYYYHFQFTKKSWIQVQDISKKILIVDNPFSEGKLLDLDTKI